MPDRLLTSRTELDDALLQMLPLARRHIRIFDGTLATFNLEGPERIALLQEFFRDPMARLTLILQDPEPCRHSPRLMALFRQRSHACELLQAPDSLANLQDSLLLLDDDHAVIHFHRDQPRGKRIDNDPAACHPYLKRFASIQAEGCTPLGFAPLGL